MRRRSDEELGDGEAVDNLHGSAAERTVPVWGSGERGRRVGACCGLIGLLEQSETEWKKLGSPPVIKKSEVADAHKTARQQVQEEASQELIDGQSHEPLLVAVGGVAPAKNYGQSEAILEIRLSSNSVGNLLRRVRITGKG